jgi:hypothetical protein
MAVPAARASWSGRVPGWVFLSFFVSLIGLTCFVADFLNWGTL